MFFCCVFCVQYATVLSYRCWSWSVLLTSACRRRQSCVRLDWRRTCRRWSWHTRPWAVRPSCTSTVSLCNWRQHRNVRLLLINDCWWLLCVPVQVSVRISGQSLSRSLRQITLKNRTLRKHNICLERFSVHWRWVINTALWLAVRRSRQIFISM